MWVVNNGSDVQSQGSSLEVKYPHALNKGRDWLLRKIGQAGDSARHWKLDFVRGLMRPSLTTAEVSKIKMIRMWISVAEGKVD
jgi:hypothetical protein